MADELATPTVDNGQATATELPEVETIEAEVEVPQDIPEPGEQEEQEYLDTDAAQRVDEVFAEIERNGKKYQVPKDLEGEFLMQADYTRKTQELAKEREALTAERTQHRQLDEQEMGARVAVKAIDAELEKYKGVDWTAEYQRDPTNAGAHKARYDQLKEQRDTAVAFINQHQSNRVAEAQRQDAKRIADTRDWATKNIPSWTEDLDRQITDFAVAQGMSREFIGGNVNPLLYGLLHKAFVGDQAIRKTAVVPRQVQKQPAVEARQPLTVVAARSGAPVKASLADLAKSDDVGAFAEAFNKRMAARGRR